MEKEQLIALVKKSQSGDAGAMERLLQYAHTSVSYQCRKMLTNAQDAEDMTQEVLVTIYTKLDTLQEPAAFHKWVNQITASRCINALNRTHVEYQFAEDEEGHSILDTLEELDEQVIPDKAIDNAETVRMIEEIVDSLPDAQRAATLMFYYNEMSVKEIAQAMRVSENTVKSRLNYARKAIKEKVLDYEKQGVKLYGLSPLPFLLYFLRLAARSSADREAAVIMVAKVMAAEGAAAAVAAGAGGAAAAAGSVATTASSTAATGILAGFSAKAAACILAAVVTIGSVAAVVIPNIQPDGGEPATAPTETHSVTESTSPETDPGTEATEIDTSTDETTWETTEAPTEESTEETTEETTEAPTAANTESVHQHSYTYKLTSPPTCSNPGEATYTCACGHSYKEAVPKNEHIWSDWVVVVEPTATTYGQKVRECELCYGAQYESIDPLTDETESTCDHNYTSEHVSPACIEDPSNQDRCDVVHTLKYTCTKCGASYTDLYEVPHDWGEWIVTTEPTTESNGGETRWCQDERCQMFEGRVIPKLPSDETEPTETEDAAVAEHTCDYVVTEYVEHTCTTGGWTTAACTICGNEVTQYRSALWYHIYENGACIYCGLSASEIQASCAHTYDGGVEHWPAGTMTWEPYILYTCTVCGHTYTELIDYLS